MLSRGINIVIILVWVKDHTSHFATYSQTTGGTGWVSSLYIPFVHSTRDAMLLIK